jgi:hypothetical protein
MARPAWRRAALVSVTSDQTLRVIVNQFVEASLPYMRREILDALDPVDRDRVIIGVVDVARSRLLPPRFVPDNRKWIGCRLCGRALADDRGCPDLGWSIMSGGSKSGILHVPSFDLEWVGWESLCRVITSRRLHRRFVGIAYPGAGNAPSEA